MLSADDHLGFGGVHLLHHRPYQGEDERQGHQQAVWPYERLDVAE